MAGYQWPPRGSRKIKWAWGFRSEPCDTPGRLNWTTEPATSWTLNLPGFNDALLRKGDCFILPLAETSTYPLIGAIALHWGDFEIKMDELLAHFVNADADPDDHGWQGRGFQKRKALLIGKARTRFPGRIADEIERILRAASEYHWQRNLIVHGHFTAHVDNGTVTITAGGVVNKRHVQMPITDEHLERAYHEISILAGRITQLTAGPKMKRCWLSSRDRSTLRAFVKKHPSNPPKPQRLAPRHPPLKALSVMHRLPKWRRPKA